MSIETAQWCVALAGGWLGCGLAFGLAFIALGGPARIDPAARGMPWGARVLLLPGLAALWPLMLWKWLHQRQPPVA